ncbi:MAG: amidase [Verrucomicrobiales bacterium]
MRWIFILLAAAFICCTNLAAASSQITTNDVMAAEKMIGLEFSDAKREMLLPGVREQLSDFKRMREVALPNQIPPAILFNPLPLGFRISAEPSEFLWTPPSSVSLPNNRNELAWYSVAQLSVLVRSKQIRSVELTRFFLERLKKFGPKLEAIVTLTEELALEQAAQADKDLADGKYHGPLHGIPFAAKDLLATKGIRTTWGSVPYKDQVLDEDATVIRKLREAGAVLVAKTTLGELAWGDVWFGGTTRNPWNTDEGSSGSSAGSAASVSAGLVPFAIGSETHGSIVSPATRCGVTGLRPTYGRVSRAGAMPLSWSMDKIGPICRTVEDTALVFNAIYGLDERDQTIIEAPFRYGQKLDWSKVIIGYVEEDFARERTGKAADQRTLDNLRKLGATLKPVKLPPLPVGSISFVLSVEAAAAFDDLTRSGRDDQLVRQIRMAWPNVFREARFIPAVEYLQAQRIRYLLIQEMAKVMKDVDAVVAPVHVGESLLITNLTGHPSVVIPNGFTADQQPLAITFIGRLFDEGTLLTISQAAQSMEEAHRKHPPGF